MKPVGNRLTVAILSFCHLMPFTLLAEEKREPDEVIIVTGSYVRHSDNFESPSPLTIVDQIEINATGAKSIADITQTLTVNTGTQNNADAYTQDGTLGTSNMNLRGLGLASTLVLLNNKRQVTSAIQTNDGIHFVDTSSLIPMIALNRVEIIKDGASPLYGSDAVAGVANFVTTQNFDGAQISVDYLDGAHAKHSESTVQGLWGTTHDKSSTMAAISYTKRNPLTQEEFRLSRPQDEMSTLGNPGAFFIMPPYVERPIPVIDPNGCAEFGGYPQLLPDTGPGPDGTDVGFCGFDFGPYHPMVAKESKLNAYFATQQQLSKRVRWKSEFSYARNRAERGSSPSFPLLTLPVVPADHPENPFGIAVAFYGRPMGNGYPANESATEAETFRFSTLLQGELEHGFWELSYLHATNDFLYTVNDALAQEFQNALNGFGGINCDPVSGSAGVDSCEYFNPFATSFNTAPNSQSVIDSFMAQQSIDAQTKLQIFEGLLSFPLFEMEAGTAEIAIGIQHRADSLEQDYSKYANENKFAFALGNPDIYGEQDVRALFTELALPLTHSLDLQLAARYEDYGREIGHTLDPKVALSWRATETLSLRGSVSSSFRAPSVYQREGSAKTLNPVVDPLNGTTAFAAINSTGNRELKPEESVSGNLGLSFEPVHHWKLELDYWWFKFEELITRESYQAIVNADPKNIDRVIRTGDPLTGPIQQVNATYVNASSLKTSGIDFTTRYQWQSDYGQFSPELQLTYIIKYDLVDPQAGKIDGAGLRNFNNIGTSAPELRSNIGLHWRHESHSASAYVRYISGYDDDQNCAEGTANRGSCEGGLKEVESHTTFDAQYNLNLSGYLEDRGKLLLSLGGINLTNKKPPQLFTNTGYDSRVHDPRGRMLYGRLTYEF